MKLNATQSKLLDILRDRSSSYTLDELASLLELSSKSSVHYNLKKLMQSGYLKANPSRPSDYIVLDHQDRGVYYLPLYQGAKCGPDGTLIPDFATTEIAVSSLALPFNIREDNALAMKTQGDSMEPKIPEGAVVIVNKDENTYDPNKTYLVVYENKPLIKNLYFDEKKKYYILSSFNSLYQPFMAAARELRIIGKVRAVINHL